MGRFIRRPTIGLALGGGGARGLAHIGIWKVFEMEGIPIDFIAGASMGGVVGLAIAAGKSAEFIEQKALEFSRMRNLVRLVDVNPTSRGMVVSARLRDFLMEIFDPSLTFNQLDIPTAVTSVDINCGKLVIVNGGSVVDAAMMTSAFPGIFPPIQKGNAYYVDGGVLNNLPADIVRQMGAEFVIAVNVTPEFPRQTSLEIEEAKRLLPGFLPRQLVDFYLAEMIMIASLVNIHLEKARPEMIIAPPIPDDLSVFLGFPRAAEAISAGVESAVIAISELKKKIKPGLRFTIKL